MSVSESGKYALLDQLAEEFAERFRRGERPSLKEYLDGYPDLADDIRSLFPAMVEVEQAEGDRREADQPAAATGPVEQLGDFRILREIGQGGMGVVYEAEQVSLGRHVALKVLPRKMLPDARAKRRFEREAKAAAKLHHTNIVPVFGVGEHDGLPYYVMQFIPGQGLDLVLNELHRLKAAPPLPTRTDGDSPQPALKAGRPGDDPVASLARSLLTGAFQAGAEPSPVPEGTGESPEAAEPYPPFAPGPLSASSATQAVSSGSITLPGQSGEAHNRQTKRQTYWQSVAQVGVQVADALEHAHKQGIVHRDIKPSNLLLDAQGRVWVTDFGLAKADDQKDLTAVGDILGTLRYMPPEAFEGRTGPCSDVYALGLTLYELVALRPAFAEKERAKLVRRITTEDAPRLRDWQPGVPRDLETIIHKAIDRDQGRRYQTAGEMAADLQRFLDDLPIQARRSSGLERTWRWCRRNPAVAALTASVAGLMVIITVGSLLAALWLDRQRQAAVNNETRAVEAERRTNQSYELLESYLALARANRRTGQVGQRFKSLEVLAQAAAFRPSLELRNEVIASLTLADLRVEKQWELLPGTRVLAFDAALERYALTEGHGDLAVRRVADNQEIIRLPGLVRQVVQGAPQVGGPLPGGLMPLRRYVEKQWEVLPDPAHVVRFSPDGLHLAAKYHPANQEARNQLLLWDLRTGKVILKVPGGIQGTAVEFSPDGRWLAVGQADGALLLFDVVSGRELKRLAAGVPPTAICFHPQGQKLAVSSFDRRTVQIWDLDTAKLAQTIRQPSGVYHLAWDPDGKLLATACQDYRCYVWQVDSGLRQAVLEGHQAEVVWVLFNRSGDLLASASWDGTTRLWDPSSGRMLLTSQGLAVQFGPDDRLAFINKFAMGIWQVEAARECRTFADPPNPGKGPYHADISPDGRWLASCSDDDGVRLRELSTGREVAHLPSGCYSAIFHPDGKSLITSGGAGLHRWPIRPGLREAAAELQVGPPERLGAERPAGWASLSGNQRTLVVSRGGDAQLLDLTNPAQSLVLRGQPGIEKVAVSPDGRWAAAGCWHGAGARVWDCQTGRSVKDLLPQIGVVAVAFSPDGRWLVTACGQGVTFWEVGTWEAGLQIPCRGECLAFSPDGRLLAVCDSPYVVKLFAPTDGRQLAALEAPNLHPIAHLCFSPDGSQLAAACTTHVVQVWDLRRLRRQLAAMGLDWESPPYPPAPATWTRPPLQMRVLLGDLATRGLTPEEEQERRAAAAAAAHRGDWSGVAAVYTELLKLEPNHPWLWYEVAVVQAHLGHKEEYRRLCREMLERFGDTEDPTIADCTSKTCVLLAGPTEDRNKLARLLDLAGTKRPDQRGMPWVLMARGLADYRAGRWADAAGWLEKSLAKQTSVYVQASAHFLLAMTQQRLGQSEAARATLARAREITERQVPTLEKSGTFWHDWLINDLLRREAETLLGSTGPEPKN
jgi:WD40 repeat protein/serine/threonine protein kinase/tetratricopeptide (TPR) repeat protein